MKVFLPDTKGGSIFATRVELDQYGRWLFRYRRRNSLCGRPIFDDAGIIRYPRKPLGKDLIATAAVCIGRQLSPAEESAVMDLPTVS